MMKKKKNMEKQIIIIIVGMCWEKYHTQRIILILRFLLAYTELLAAESCNFFSSINWVSNMIKKYYSSTV